MTDADPANDWVLTGSWNIQRLGTYSDIQNIILIQDESLARSTRPRSTRCGDPTGNTPDPNLSRFSAMKLDDTPKRVSIAGHPGQVYFGAVGRHDAGALGA